MKEPSCETREPPSAELQRLWFATLKREWSSLVVVPAHPGGAALAVGRGLAQVAALHKDGAVKLIAVEGADLQSASRLIIEMTAHVAAGGVAIVVLESVVGNPAGIPIALAADAALLCVRLGEADLESAERTVELIGAERIIGAVALDAKG